MDGGVPADRGLHDHRPCRQAGLMSGECGRTRLRRSTFQVNTLACEQERRESRLRLRTHKRGDLVKRCDQPGEVLIQLESLILAQSERWRQA